MKPQELPEAWQESMYRDLKLSMDSDVVCLKWARRCLTLRAALERLLSKAPDGNAMGHLNQRLLDCREALAALERDIAGEN